MELPPFNRADFESWKDKNFIIKECDMDTNMKKEAAEHILNGIEKMTVSGEIDVLNAATYIKE